MHPRLFKHALFGSVNYWSRNQLLQKERTSKKVLKFGHLFSHKFSEENVYRGANNYRYGINLQLIYLIQLKVNNGRSHS